MSKLKSSSLKTKERKKDNTKREENNLCDQVTHMPQEAGGNERSQARETKEDKGENDKEKTDEMAKNDKVKDPTSSKSEKPKKKLNPAVLAIKRMQEAMKAKEEEERRMEEEERRREEEEKRLEEERARHKEIERQKRLEARKLQQGSKAERERLRIDREKIALLLHTSSIKDKHGLQEEALKGGRVKDTEKPLDKNTTKHPVYVRKKKPHKSQAPSTTRESTEKTTTVTSKAGDVLESWEDALDDEVEELEPSFTKLSLTSEKATPALEINKSSSLQESFEVKTQTKQNRFMSPILCVLGHVDTGKTKLLDKLRETSVQANEAGGITQQIGATFFPREAIVDKMCISEDENDAFSSMVEIPGLVVIDTPGHASFANLRSRGSSLCHLAVLVVDLMHGIEPQTLESIELLRARRTPFIVALNKIDRIYSWKSLPNAHWETIEQAQSSSALEEFEKRLQQCILAFAEQASLNAEMHTRNKNPRRVVSLVPISALTGEGIADLLRVIVEMTQQRLGSSLLLTPNHFDGMVLEVRTIEGLGTIIDIIISQGILEVGDKIVIAGMPCPITTEIRALLTPEGMKETRVKVLRYNHHERVIACMGVRIVANGLETAIAGSRIIRLPKHCDDSDGKMEKTAREELEEECRDVLTAQLVERGQLGVTVQASTLGSLEALLTFLKTEHIPVAVASIGTIYKRDILAASVTVERHLGIVADARDYAVVLAFDVKVDREAQELAEELGIRIFQADIIYHLLDAFKAHRVALVEQRKRELAPQAVFPCSLRIVPGCVFNKRSPLVMGVDVVEGSLHIGTPLAAYNVRSRELVTLGRVTSIELNHRSVNVVRRGSPSVAIKIETNDAPRMFGRHFDEGDEILSVISRSSIDVLKAGFREEMSGEDWQLVRRLKPLFGIP